ncbi:hypothetical protein K32_46820 [Kaistia sp. 32K]|uniref:hypothetical protein n=1 Tax=Kaistia sp. 32K TaxID=2795690 RepID=UPI0019161AF7|nr:hypothetical protein [Kaistia sp. 32K]BCP56065.1 hypothetical protein K32_46820 [Kaistia sp. 32K]
MSRLPISRDFVGTGLLFVGIAALAVALGWWGLVFGNVAANTTLSLPAAVPCLVNTSDLCSLAMSLCGSGHWFGITRYSEGLFWAGFALTAMAATFQFALGAGARAEKRSRIDR